MTVLCYERISFIYGEFYSNPIFMVQHDFFFYLSLGGLFFFGCVVNLRTKLCLYYDKVHIV